MPLFLAKCPLIPLAYGFQPSTSHKDWSVSSSCRWWRHCGSSICLIRSPRGCASLPIFGDFTSGGSIPQLFWLCSRLYQSELTWPLLSPLFAAVFYIILVSCFLFLTVGTLPPKSNVFLRFNALSAWIFVLAIRLFEFSFIKAHECAVCFKFIAIIVSYWESSNVILMSPTTFMTFTMSILAELSLWSVIAFTWYPFRFSPTIFLHFTLTLPFKEPTIWLLLICCLLSHSTILFLSSFLPLTALSSPTTS